MDYDQIRAMPTTLTREEIKDHVDHGARGVHESVLRAYQILGKVKWLIEKGTAPEVIEELIRMMERPMKEDQK